MADTYGEIVRELDGKPNREKGGYNCHCPNCGDRGNSRHLHVSEGAGGKVLVCCYKCRDQDAVIAALRERGLWNGKGSNGSSLPPAAVELKPAREKAPKEEEEPTFTLPVPSEREEELRAAPREDWCAKKYGELAGVWDYRDAEGHLLYVRARFNQAEGKKQIIPFCLTADGPKPRDPFKGKASPLYRLEALADAGSSAPVLLVEGESCADVAARYLVDAGMPHVATTWSGGAGAPKDRICWEPLKGRQVVLWPDKDKPGFDAMAEVARVLVPMGCRVSTITPPEELQEGEDIADLNAADWPASQIRALIEKASAPELRFKLRRLGEIGIEKPDWLVRGLIEREELSCLFGDPSTYKSFLAVDLAACIATGKDFHGHAVRQGPVVYIAGEGQRGIRKRFKAWELVHGIDLAGAPVFLAAQPADLVDERALQDLIAAVQQAASVVGEPCLIVFDTLARSFGSGDENSSQDMNTLIASSDRLRAVFGCAVLFVHHSGIADKGRGRGSSVLRGALDSEFRMDKDPEGVCRLESTKMKDSEPPAPMAFRLRVVDLGFTDDEGADVTSCVLDPVDYTVPERKAPDNHPNQEKLVRALRDGIERNRQRLIEGNVNPDTARVTVEDWRAACKSLGVERNRFAEARDALMRKGTIVLESPYVRLA